MADEKAIRERLGIPAGAERVIVFGETSHWDPDWLFTSEEYYRLRIRKILDLAVAELLREPRRVFSVECIFFLKMYWERNPEKREAIRDLVNRGRMRLTGSGLTTPDTTLPETESIIRDFLLGQEWLRANGMSQEPRLAYLPDDFGHSPALPSILHALGYEMAAFARIDGGFFLGSDYRSSSYYPRPGSCAHLLQRELRSLDFFWVGPDLSRVLCHWNPFTYFQGDAIALRGFARWMGINAGIPSRSPRSVAKRIDAYAARLMPLSRTPYLFCPIGCDFVEPIRDLVSLLDGYNDHRFRETGLWALNAGLDDYLELVSCHAEKIPQTALDPNPCWMGFYSSRPEMKQRCRQLGRGLVKAEKLYARAMEKDPGLDLDRELAAAWEILAVSNHHDFITGTAPDRVFNKEQRPWLIQAQERVEAVSDKARAVLPEAPGEPARELPEWSLSHGRLLVETPYYLIELDERLGGCITAWNDAESSAGNLLGMGNDLVLSKDTGGLWRMGHEFRGGTFKARMRASRQPARIRASEQAGVLEAVVETMLEGRRVTRRLCFMNDSPVVKMGVEGAAGKRRAITCRFATSFRPEGLSMDVPGGVVERPLVKIYDPTFWPALNFVHLRDAISGRGLAVFFATGASVSADSNGVIEWVTLRNAPRERAFGFLPIPSCPAYGEDPHGHVIEYAVWFTSRGGWRENGLWRGPDRAAAGDEEAVSTDNAEVRVSAVKKASRGPGMIVRLLSFGPGHPMVRLKYQGRAIRSAMICDGRERPLSEVMVADGEARLAIRGFITTVRIDF